MDEIVASRPASENVGLWAQIGHSRFFYLPSKILANIADELQRSIDCVYYCHWPQNSDSARTGVSDSHLIVASNRRQILCAVASFLTIVFPLLHASDASCAEDDGLEAIGSVEEAGGEAFAEIKEKRRMLERASPIFVNDQVGTGSDSRVELRLGEHTKIRLGERARLKIDRFLLNTGGEITLDTGPMLFEKRDGRPMPVSIRSSYGVIDVRGTRFFVGPSNNVFGVFVDEGSVTVTAGGRRVILRAGEGTDISKPGTRPTAPKRWGQPRIKAAYASVQ
jgi:hypothetical protein